jgi:hypothetical protein
MTASPIREASIGETQTTPFLIPRFGQPVSPVPQAHPSPLPAGRDVADDPNGSDQQRTVFHPLVTGDFHPLVEGDFHPLLEDEAALIPRAACRAEGLFL